MQGNFLSEEECRYHADTRIAKNRKLEKWTEEKQSNESLYSVHGFTGTQWSVSKRAICDNVFENEILVYQLRCEHLGFTVKYIRQR